MDRRTVLIAGLGIAANPWAFIRKVCAGPQMAVVLDDAGESGNDAYNLIELKNRRIPITISMLPYSRQEAHIAEILADYQNTDIFLHQPMQPISDIQYWTEGHKDKAISMDSPRSDYANIIGQNKSHLSDVLRYYGANSIIGMNNHTGSWVTQDEKKCRAVAWACKALDLMLLDSRTIGKSRLAEQGKAAGIRTYVRDNPWLDYHLGEFLSGRFSRHIAIGHMGKKNTIDAIIKYNDKRPYALRRISELEPNA